MHHTAVNIPPTFGSILYCGKPTKINHVTESSLPGYFAA